MNFWVISLDEFQRLNFKDFYINQIFLIFHYIAVTFQWYQLKANSLRGTTRIILVKDQEMQPSHIKQSVISEKFHKSKLPCIEIKKKNEKMFSFA